MMKVVDYLPDLGHSLSYVAFQLQDGSNNPKEQKFHPIPVPEEFHQEKAGWDYSVLKRFMEAQGVDMAEQAAKYRGSESLSGEWYLV